MKLRSQCCSGTEPKNRQLWAQGCLLLLPSQPVEPESALARDTHNTLGGALLRRAPQGPTSAGVHAWPGALEVRPFTPGQMCYSKSKHAQPPLRKAVTFVLALEKNV